MRDWNLNDLKELDELFYENAFALKLQIFLLLRITSQLCSHVFSSGNPVGSGRPTRFPAPCQTHLHSTHAVCGHADGK